MKINDKVRLYEDDGWFYEGRIVSVSEETLKVHVKFKKFDRVWQKNELVETCILFEPVFVVQTH